MQIEGDQCRRCGSLQTEVIDRRYRKKVDRVIRRRKCLECGYKWNTVEVYDWDWTVCVFEVPEQCKAETKKGLNQNKRKEPASGRGKGIPGFLEKWIKRKNQ